MKWITREKVKVDRVACPWLIQRFIDPDASFIFLPQDTDWPQVHDGTVFDVSGCELGHHGEDVSVDSILKKYAEYDAVLKTLGKQGDFKANVLKINIPRSDLKVSIDGIATPTPFGFGGWLAMTKGDHGAEVMMGDLVLLEDEVNPVMSALLDNGLDVTALHNHFFFESPRIFYMHVHGHGKAADLAKHAKPAVDLIGRGSPQHQTTVSGGAGNVTAGQIDTAKIARIVGHDGEQTGSVYKITIGRD